MTRLVVVVVSAGGRACCTARFRVLTLPQGMAGLATGESALGRRAACTAVGPGPEGRPNGPAGDWAFSALIG